MKVKKLAIGILAILLVVGFDALFDPAAGRRRANSIAPVYSEASPRKASPNGKATSERRSSAANHGPSPGRKGLAQEMAGWQQVNSNGFGDAQAGEVSAVEAFSGYLYAGTHNPVSDARIFRSPDGVTWTAVTDPGFGNSHDIAPPAILDMAAFNGKLYASTGRGNASQIWRTQNGTIWAPVDVTGFGDPDNVDITSLAEYGGKIYAGVTNQVSGAQIWSSYTGDNNSWTLVAPETPGTIAAGVTAFAVFSDTHYASIEFESDEPTQIWRSYGGAWESVVSGGFGDSNTLTAGGMAVFSDTLYAGAGNTENGALLWRTTDGTNWTQAISPAFGDSNNEKVEMVFVFDNYLYVSVKNTVTGTEIWRSANGASWEQANTDGFGDANNSGANLSHATAGFLGQLYVGTSNVADGGELWRMLNPYDVDLSPDEAKSGDAGQELVYTMSITNTGAMSDTFDLKAIGNSWLTAVSTSTVSLMPGASEQFSITVSIPSEALGNDADAVSITASSQGDLTKSDSALLTTSVIPAYGVILSPDLNEQGAAGQRITYTLWITNSGNVTDSYRLESSGNLWSTQVTTPVVTLAAGAGDGVQVQVDIPAGALGEESDGATITAVSSADFLTSDSTQLVTTVRPFYGLALSPDLALSTAPGTAVTHTLTISNSGNMTDSIVLTVTGQTWTTTLSTSQVSLAPFTKVAFSVRVDIPPDAADQDTDEVTVTATSQGDGSKTDSAKLTTTSVAAPVYGVTLEADSSLSGPSGGQVVYTLTLTNTGNVADTFDLLANGNSWPTVLPAQVVTLATGASRMLQITVTIPITAAALDSDQASVMVTSQHDAGKSDWVTLTTISSGPGVKIFLPLLTIDMPQSGQFPRPLGAPGLSGKR